MLNRFAELNETQQIEEATGEGFLALYNAKFGTSYRVVRIAGAGESPDVYCFNSNGESLNIEVTMTEDRSKDIAATLGRSDTRSLEYLKRNIENAGKGLEPPLYSTLEGVSETLVDRIQAKLVKSYGSDVALVVRDTSGVDWDWDTVIPQIRSKLALDRRNSFDRGIWILSRDKGRMFRVDEF